MALVHDLVVLPQTRPLVGSVPLPSDPRIAELALMCAAIAEGDSEIRWLSQSKDVATMANALRSLGVSIESNERVQEFKDEIDAMKVRDPATGRQQMKGKYEQQIR